MGRNQRDSGGNEWGPSDDVDEDFPVKCIYAGELARPAKCFQNCTARRIYENVPPGQRGNLGDLRELCTNVRRQRDLTP